MVPIFSPPIDQPVSGHYRIPCSEACEVLSFDGYRGRGTIWNLSAVGVYSVLPPPFPPVGRTVLLTFALIGDGTPITCEARVQWHNARSIFKGCGTMKPALPPGCGLAFITIETVDAERIASRVFAYRTHRAQFERILGGERETNQRAPRRDTGAHR